MTEPGARGHFLLVGNPTAQSGRNARRIDRAAALLGAGGAAVQVLSTRPSGETIPLVRAAIEESRPDAVIAMGGDGTFREVGAGLFYSSQREETALGMIPTGTANDQGRSFGLAAGDAALETNVKVLSSGVLTGLDVGRIRAWHGNELTADTVFFDSAGWGISARVLALRNSDRVAIERGPLRHVLRGKWVYAGALLRTLAATVRTRDAFHARLVCDGKSYEWKAVTDLVIKATRVYSGSWVFDRTSRHDDGVFEVIPFVGRRDWISKAIVDHERSPLRHERLRGIGVRHSELVKASTIELTMEVPDGHAPLAAQIDGEEFVAATRVQIDVVRQGIRLIVPG